MDYKIEGLERLIVTKLKKPAEVNDDKVCIKDENLCVPRSVLPFAILLWIDVPQKILSLFHIFYGDVKRGYEIYKKYPYSKQGRICWIHKRIAKAVEQILNGQRREKVLDRLEGEILRRWPNVCYEIDNTDLALALVENLREKGFNVSLIEKGNDLYIKVGDEGEVKFNKREAKDHILLLELLSMPPENAMTALEGLVADDSCEGLRKIIKALLAAEKYPLLLSSILEHTKKLPDVTP